MKVLHLTLKKKWFDMIASGEKKEEYRELKPYWFSRLTSDKYDVEKYDIVIFRNGYKKDAPTIVVNCEGVSIGKGKTHWGAEPHEQYFVIKLGEIVKTI